VVAPPLGRLGDAKTYAALVARMETFLPTKKLEFLIVLGADP